MVPMMPWDETHTARTPTTDVISFSGHVGNLGTLKNASTENMSTKVLIHDNASKENACTDNAGTVERHGNSEYGICEYYRSCIEEVN
jgi:hypothetical protein